MLRDAPMSSYLDEYDGDIVTVARRFDPIAAELLRGRLAADGIPATLGDANLVQTYALCASALGGVRVMVPESYAKQALRAIAAIEQGDLALDDEPGADETAVAREAMPDPDAAPVAARLSRIAAATAALLLLGLVVELLRPGPTLH
jgi:hypothetical protein